jgi:hypothetical protein
MTACGSNFAYPQPIRNILMTPLALSMGATTIGFAGHRAHLEYARDGNECWPLGAASRKSTGVVIDDNSGIIACSARTCAGSPIAWRGRPTLRGAAPPRRGTARHHPVDVMMPTAMVEVLPLCGATPSAPRQVIICLSSTILVWPRRWAPTAFCTSRWIAPTCSGVERAVQR